MIQELNYDIENRIDLYLKGRLSQDQIDDLWVELIENPECYDYLKTVVSLRNIYKDQKINTQTPVYELGSPKVAVTREWFRYAAAAVVIVALGASSFLYFNSNQLQTLEPPSSLEHIVYRSVNNNDIDSSFDQLQAAIGMAVQGHTTSAILMLNQIHDEASDVGLQAEAILNIGIIEYNQDDFNAAARTFNRVANLDGIDMLIHERAMWNLAQSQVAMGDFIAARESVEKVIEMDGAHSRMAINYLKYLR